MFSLSKGEPPTPPSATTSPPASEIEAAPCELPQFQKTEGPLRVQTAPMTISSTSTDQPQTDEIGVAVGDEPEGKDSGFEASPCALKDPGCSSFSFLTDDNDVGFDDVFLDDDVSQFLLEPEDDDERCSYCDRTSSCSCSRAESSATIRAAMSSFTDPNTCDSDSSTRSSSPQSPPPPSSRPIPATCSHTHNDRLPCTRCSEEEEEEEALEDPRSAVSYLQNIVSRSYPGSYPSYMLRWWARSSASSRVSSPRGDAGPSRASNRSDDRRSTRSWRREIDSDASSSSSCDEPSGDELYHTACEEGSCVDSLRTMTEAEELRVNTPEQLPDLVPVSSELSSRRVRSQSVSIPVINNPNIREMREIGVNLRRFSDEFENRVLVRNGTLNHGGHH